MGKTLQTIAFLGHLIFERRLPGPHLVVVPLSVLSSWAMECQRWAPTIRHIRLHATDKRQRERLMKEITHAHEQYDLVSSRSCLIRSAPYARMLWYRCLQRTR